MCAVSSTESLQQGGGSTKRRYYQRSRSGCLTCRYRHIKCDEKRPVCTHCAKAQQSCFWPQSTRFQATFDDYDGTQKSDSPSDTLSVLRAINVYQSHVGSPAEIRSFQFFIEEAAFTASAYFGHSFWTQTVPQMSWSTHVLKHAAIAFSALVEKYNTDSDQFMTTSVYLKCWQNAIRGAADLIDEKRAEDVLVLCLLLTLCNFMESDLEAGYLHIRSGMNIIAQYYSNPLIQRKNLERIGNIASIFVSIASKAPTYGCKLVWPSTFPRSIQPSDELPYIPRAFSSLAHAEHCQSGLLHMVLQFRRRSGNGQGIHCLWQRVADALQNWDKALTLWENSTDKPSRTKLEPSIQLLKVYVNVLSILTDDASGHQCYEGNIDKFRLLIDSMRNMCNSADENIAQWFYQQGQIDGHIGYIPPLFFTAVKCPDRNIREEASSLLSALHVEEGAWTSCLAAAVATKISLIEEQLQHTVTPGTERLLITVEGLRRKPASKRWLLDYAVKTHGFFTAIRVSSELDLCTCAQRLNPQALAGVIGNLGFQGERMSQPSSCATVSRSAIQSDRRQKLHPRPNVLEEVEAL